MNKIIINNNYKLYLLLNELAKNSSINIVT